MQWCLMDNSFLNNVTRQPKPKVLLLEPKNQTRAERTLTVELRVQKKNMFAF